MPITNSTNGNYNPKQLKLPLEIEKIIEELGTDYPEFKDKESISDYLTRITLKELK